MLKQGPDFDFVISGYSRSEVEKKRVDYMSKVVFTSDRSKTVVLVLFFRCGGL